MIKNYNTYKYILLCIIVSMLATSCVKDDLLNRSNPSDVDEDKAWTTDYLTRLGINGVYAALRLGMNDSGDSKRELYQFDRFGTSQYRYTDNMLDGTAPSNDGLFLNVWKDMYEGIGRANNAIYYIPQRSQSNADNKARYIAEAKFLRAYFYTRLNQVFKGVPLYDEPIILGETDKARESEQAIWDFIIRDLNDCLSEPETILPNKIDKGSSEYGRVTRGAAYALRGKVFMYLKKYEDAINDFEKVKECGYDLFQGDFKTLFTEANEQCEEMIFSIQNIGQPKLGSSMQFIAGLRTTINGGGWTHYMVDAFVVDLYENKDGSKFNWDDAIPGYSNFDIKDREVFFLRDTVGLVQQFTDRGMTSETAEAEAQAIQKAVADRLNTFSAEARAKYLPNGNEARIKSVYDNRDPRLSASIITPYSTFIGSKSDTDIEVGLRWPYRNDNFGVQDIRTDVITKFVYLHRKFMYEGTTSAPNRAYGPIDFPIIRYADVLLMKAEALAELGRTAEAITAVNLVRKRAGVAELNSSPATAVNGKDDLINRIRNERRVEFVNEGISYFDELRWGTLKETMLNKKVGFKQIWGTLENPCSWDDKLVMWAIPQKEREMNPNLSQNPGWGN